MAIAVTAPIFYTPLYVIKTKWKELTFSGKGLIITCLFEFVHYMDFPFLRDNVEFAVFGYIVAILIMFSLGG